MRFQLHIAPAYRHEFTASGAAELLFGILDGIALFSKSCGAGPPTSALCTLAVEHTAGGFFSSRWLEVWQGPLQCELARAGEFLEAEDPNSDNPRPVSRAEALWCRAVGVRLDEVLKGR